MSSHNLWKQLLAEFVGTFLFVLIGAGAVAYFASRESEFSLVTAIAFGTVMAVIVYLFGCISGSHVNPAVSLGFALTSRMSWGTMFLYWIAQFLGGILAAIVIYWIFDKETGASIGTLTNTDAWKAVFVEALITTILVFSMLYMTKNWKVSLMGGVVIGCVLVFNYIFAGNLTGASANPARSLGPAIMGTGQWTTLWIYFVGPLIGAIIAAILYSIMNMSGYSVLKDCDGNVIKNDCCDAILGKEVPMRDNCGNPVKDNCGNQVIDTKYKIDIKKKDQYRFFKKEDCGAAKGGHTKYAHKLLCEGGDADAIARLAKVGPDHDAYGKLGLKEAALARVGKSQQQELADFVAMKQKKDMKKCLEKQAAAVSGKITEITALAGKDNLGNSFRAVEVDSMTGSVAAGTMTNAMGGTVSGVTATGTGVDNLINGMSRQATGSVNGLAQGGMTSMNGVMSGGASMGNTVMNNLGMTNGTNGSANAFQSLGRSVPRMSTGNVKLPSLNQLTEGLSSASRPFSQTTSLNKAFTGMGAQ